MRLQKSLLSVGIAASMFYTSTVLAAQKASDIIKGSMPTDLKGVAPVGNLTQTFFNVVAYVLTFVGLAFVILIIYAGIRWMLSAGDQKVIQHAKEVIYKGVVGMTIIVGSVGIVFLIIQSVAPAEDGSMGQQLGLPIDLKVSMLNMVRSVLGLVGIVFVAMVVYAGAVVMFSRGDAAKIKEAKAVVVNAAIGFVLMFFAFTIVTFIINAVSPKTATSLVEPLLHIARIS